MILITTNHYESSGAEHVRFHFLKGWVKVRVDLKPGTNIPVQLPSLYAVKTNEQ